MKIGIAGNPFSPCRYADALRLCMPDIETERSLDLSAAGGWDALILPGGGDIDPQFLPGYPPLDSHCSDVDPVLDEKQLSLLDLFVHSGRPVLGICKGMQLINLYFGGGLCQHLSTAEAHRYKQYDQLHSTHAEEGSFLCKLYGRHFVTNSAHHQGISQPGKKITVIQRADDGVAEGIIHDTLPVIGLQWHPERLCGSFARPDAIDGSLIFQYYCSLI